MNYGHRPPRINSRFKSYPFFQPLRDRLWQHCPRPRVRRAQVENHFPYSMNVMGSPDNVISNLHLQWAPKSDKLVNKQGGTVEFHINFPFSLELPFHILQTIFLCSLSLKEENRHKFPRHKLSLNLCYLCTSSCFLLGSSFAAKVLPFLLRMVISKTEHSVCWISRRHTSPLCSFNLVLISFNSLLYNFPEWDG